MHGTLLPRTLHLIIKMSRRRWLLLFPPCHGPAHHKIRGWRLNSRNGTGMIVDSLMLVDSWSSDSKIMAFSLFSFCSFTCPTTSHSSSSSPLTIRRRRKLSASLCHAHSMGRSFMAICRTSFSLFRTSFFNVFPGSLLGHNHTLPDYFVRTLCISFHTPTCPDGIPGFARHFLFHAHVPQRHP